MVALRTLNNVFKLTERSLVEVVTEYETAQWIQDQAIKRDKSHDEEITLIPEKNHSTTL